ncbi:unnamed protein product [Rhizophagus irregularis]|nr:unnamed protein product [Rhizophagus irregularis]
MVIRLKNEIGREKDTETGRCGVSTNLTNPQEKSRDQVSMIGCGNQVIASVPTISEETVMEEVVKVIREYREEEKVKIERINYERFIATKNILLNSEILRDYVTPKVEELKNIFVSCGEEMEWTAIEKEVYGDTRVKHVSEMNLGLSNFEIDRSWIYIKN